MFAQITRRFLVLAFMCIAQNSFADCPSVGNSNKPSMFIAVSSYSIYFYVQKTVRSSEPFLYEGAAVVVRDGQEIFREDKLEAEDDWFGFFSVNGKAVGFSFDSYTKDFKSAWLKIDEEKIQFDSGLVRTSESEAIACP